MNKHILVKCPGCGATVALQVPFCPNCGTQINKSKSPPITNPIPNNGNKTSTASGLVLAIAIGLGVMSLVVITAVFISRSGNVTSTKTNSKQTKDIKPDLPVPDFEKLKKDADASLALGSKFRMTHAQRIREELKRIPSDDKNYGAAIELLGKIQAQIDTRSAAVAKEYEKRSAKRNALIDIIGPEPPRVWMKYRFNEYLRERLNDYNSSEYVSYSDARVVYIKKKPYWRSTLQLRAKNGFGAYVLRNVRFYFRNLKIVKVEGL